MKKRLVLITVLVLAICCLGLSACNNEELVDYTGNATITFTFDKECKNIQISCPKATISKESEIKYIVSLDNLVPVEVIVSAEGKEPQKFYFTYDDLKAGNIEKTIVFEERMFKMEVEFSDKNAVPKINDSNIDIVKTDEKYEIVSKNKIIDDLVVTFGESYYDAIIPANMFKYTLGNIGKIDKTITVLKKEGGKALVQSPIKLTIESVQKRKRYDLMANTSQIVDIDDYVIMERYSGNCIGHITKEELAENPYYLIKFNNSLSIERSDVFDVFFANRYIALQKDRSTYGDVVTNIFTNGNFYEGEIFKISIMVDNYTTNDYLYKITKQDIDSGILNITDDKLIAYDSGQANNNNVKIKFKWLDDFGNPIKLKSANYEEKEYVYDSATGIWKEVIVTTDLNNVVDYNSYTYGNILEKIELVDNNGVNYTFEKIYLERQSNALNNHIKQIISCNAKVGDYYEIPIILEPVYKKTLKFVDAKSNEVIKTWNYNISDYLKFRLPEESCYVIVDSNAKKEEWNEYYIIFTAKEYPNDIEIKVEKTIEVNVNFTNPEFVEGQNVNFKCKELNDCYINFDNNKLIFVESQIGKSFYFSTSEYSSFGKYEKFSFVVTLTEGIVNSGTINVTIDGTINEWQDVENNYDYNKY